MSSERKPLRGSTATSEPRLFRPFAGRQRTRRVRPGKHRSHSVGASPRDWCEPIWATNLVDCVNYMIHLSATSVPESIDEDVGIRAARGVGSAFQPALYAT